MAEEQWLEINNEFIICNQYSIEITQNKPNKGGAGLGNGKRCHLSTAQILYCNVSSGERKTLATI